MPPQRSERSYTSGHRSSPLSSDAPSPTSDASSSVSRASGLTPTKLEAMDHPKYLDPKLKMAEFVHLAMANGCVGKALDIMLWIWIHFRHRILACGKPGYTEDQRKVSATATVTNILSIASSEGGAGIRKVAAGEGYALYGPIQMKPRPDKNKTKTKAVDSAPRRSATGTLSTTRTRRPRAPPPSPVETSSTPPIPSLSNLASDMESALVQELAQNPTLTSTYPPAPISPAQPSHLQTLANGDEGYPPSVPFRTRPYRSIPPSDAGDVLEGIQNQMSVPGVQHDEKHMLQPLPPAPLVVVAPQILFDLPLASYNAASQFIPGFDYSNHHSHPLLGPGESYPELSDYELIARAADAKAERDAAELTALAFESYLEGWRASDTLVQ